MTEGAEAPMWFRNAVAVPWTDATVDVDGGAIHFLTAGDPDCPPLVFLHAAAAHAHWWTHVAAPLTADHHVVLIDLSGHGDSCHRDQYCIERFVRDTEHVIDAERLDRPVILGHSMGAIVGLAVATKGTARLGGVVAVDPPLLDPTTAAKLDRRGTAIAQRDSVFSTFEEAVARFRAVPDQATTLPYVLDHIARQSITTDKDGHDWKFDRRVLGGLVANRHRTTLASTLTEIAGSGLPVALIACEDGMISPAGARALRDATAGAVPIVDLPNAGHHPMLDEPLALLAALRSILAIWSARAAGGHGVAACTPAR